MPNHYITTAVSRDDAESLFAKVRKKYMQQEYGATCDKVEVPTVVVSQVPGFNCSVKVWEYQDSGRNAAAASCYMIRTKHEAIDGVNTCLVRIPAHIVGEGEAQEDTYDYFLLLSNAAHFADVTVPEELQYKHIINYYDNNGLFIESGNEILVTLYIDEVDAVALNSDYQNNHLSRLHFTSAGEDAVTTIRNAGSYYAMYMPATSGRFINRGLIELQGAGSFTIFNFDALPYPVFDYTDTDSVINFLNTGDRSGEIDPFDPLNPSLEKITDFKTDFDMWISKDKVSITSSNAQYYENRSTLTGLYKLIVSANDVEQEPSASQIPTVTINPIEKVNQAVDMAFIGDLQLLPYPESSGYFKVNLVPNPKKQCGFNIASVYYADHYANKEEAEPIDRSIVGENYVYSKSGSGEKLTIHFSEITLDDLKDLVDDGYINREDENDDESGSDILGQFGSGYGTYKINDGAFEDINDAMWSTDWSTLFKPTTTSPTQCIISCKRIPFTIGGSGVSEIPIANLSVEITGSAAKVNQVKSFTLPNLQIPAIYGNFVDQYMAKVRVYLPYIGWAELPADAVVSKVGRASVGLQSETRILGFKYIVDFVDGNCKCVISVNGTERWMFEGNCGCDVPITSDNHSAALTRSAKGLMASAMTVAAGVITTASGNAMMGIGEIAGGALSALNSVPNYSYTASANISGLIEASSNHHLMVVVEYPNAWYPNGTAHKVGLPCELYLNLAQCSGFTKCADVDVSGIDCTSDEADMIRSLLTEGVYL